jgi:hypothetical protein
VSIAEDIRASVFIADYAAPDPTGKLNAIGLHWQVTALQVTGMTPAHAVVAALEAPPVHSSEEVAVSLTLQDESGQAAKIMGPTGAVQDLRVQQVAKFEKPNVPGVPLHDKVWSRANVILTFVNGLPLQPNHAYTWVLEVDGNTRPDWRAAFYVGAPPSPVFG